MSPIQTAKKTSFRWSVCSLLFIATLINYIDRQTLSLTWNDYIAPEFAWTDEDYGHITSYFALIYAISMLFAGDIISRLGIKKGYAWSMAIWSLGALLHAFCGIVACGLLTETWVFSFDGAKEVMHDMGVAGLPITTMTVTLFIVCRCILAFGQSGNFPSAVTVTAEYFPKKDRAFAISIFNNGACVGSLLSPIVIPMLASNFGWEMAFFVTGSIGYLWVLVWLLVYAKPENNDYVNAAEYAYITQDDRIGHADSATLEEPVTQKKETKRISIMKSLTRPETWALIAGKFLTDGAWWFFLFWTPIYISDFYGYSSDSAIGISLIVVLYLICMLSCVGAYLPTYFINKHGMTPNASRARSMFIFAFVQLLGFTTIPLGNISPWLFVIVIGILGASHQSWSANIFSMVGDYFPKSSIPTVTGIIGFAGGIGSHFIMRYSGTLFTYADSMGETFNFFGYEGKQAAYMILFSIFAVTYLIGWCIMRLLILNTSLVQKLKK